MAAKTDPLARAYDPATPVLSELERRVLANLSVPTNPEYAATRTAGFATAPPEEIDKLLRGKLSDEGWVVNLGASDDPAHLASKAQNHKEAIDIPDGKAKTWAKRLTNRPDLAWRAQGDLWMLTNDGLAELHAPTVDSPPMPPSQVQAVVNAEWSRTVHELKHDKDGHLQTDLTGKLTEEVFALWFKDVAAECERAWGVRPKAPMSGGASGYADAYENLILDAENQKTALGAVVDPFFMALSIVALADADTGTTTGDGTHIPTYTGYARVSVPASSMPAASGAGGSTANTTAITWAACTAGTSTIISIGQCSAVTAGTLRKWADVASTVISTTQTPPTLAVGAYVTTVT